MNQSSGFLREGIFESAYFEIWLTLMALVLVLA